jgi:Holliday junction resolvase RusA-like endonuclease
MKSFSCCIKGDPVALQRPRFSVGHRGKPCRVFDAQKSEKFLFGLELERNFDGVMLQGPLYLEVTFFMPMPNTSIKRKTEEYDGTYRDTIPDLDNLIKFICDACQNIIYENDSKVVHLHARKIYSFNPRVEFRFTEIPRKPQTEHLFEE